VSSIVFYSGDQDVYALLIAPRDPRTALIVVPGAGVRKEAHAERAAAYAQAGIVTLIIDTRGNSGETAGPAPGVEEDYRRFRSGEWAVFYRQGCDIVAAASYLRQRFGTDVYVMGESSGGRYAVLAAAADPRISGLVAVSTSGFDRYGSTIAGDPAVFIESIDPDRLISCISPRPVWVFHAPEDTFIPITDGIRLYSNAKEPRKFVNFSGTHGINGHVDEWVVETFGKGNGIPAGPSAAEGIPGANI
jgi:dienelactone hydrolase